MKLTPEVLPHMRPVDYPTAPRGADRPAGPIDLEQRPKVLAREVPDLFEERSTQIRVERDAAAARLIRDYNPF